VTPSRPTTGTRVSFKLAEVICPEPGQLVNQVGPDLEVVGEIVFVSDGDGRQDKFAIVEVAGLLTPVIVPVGELSWQQSQAPAATRTRIKEN